MQRTTSAQTGDILSKTYSKLSRQETPNSVCEVYKQLDDEWPESIFHHVGNQSASYPVSV